jgi:hypothetical protein
MRAESLQLYPGSTCPAVASAKADDCRSKALTKSELATERQPNVTYDSHPGCKGLPAGRLGCGDDLVEALITAQIIPARIEPKIAVCRA